MKILFLVPYPLNEAPSQRFRFEQYFVLLGKKEISFDVQSFIDLETWKVLYAPRKFFKKFLGMLHGFVRRFLILFKVSRYDFIFIHREAAPLGPPIFEFVIAKVLRKKIIYDFDDAIWLANVSSSNQFVSGLKWYSKINSICTWSHKISCGNHYLKDFALQFNSNITVNPTTVDTNNLHNKIKNQLTKKVVIGWTGTHTTIVYLNEILPVIRKIEESHDIEFCVISNKKPDFELRSLNFIPWKKETEIEDLLRINIGIMPMPVNEWTQGKCGFKLLQYMSLGIPSLASPLEANKKIIDHNENGFICKNPEEWIASLELLITDMGRRTTMGKSARKKIENHFSFEANSPVFLSLFK